jgi:predicted DNA-binding WGR domain protein
MNTSLREHLCFNITANMRNFIKIQPYRPNKMGFCARKWSIERRGKKVYVWFGPCTADRRKIIWANLNLRRSVKPKSFSSDAAAEHFVQDMIASKIAKGYKQLFNHRKRSNAAA